MNGFARMGAAPMLQTSKGSEHPAGRLSLLVGSAGRLGAGAGGGQIWITGRASGRAASQLATRGWTGAKAVGKLGE